MGLSKEPRHLYDPDFSECPADAYHVTGLAGYARYYERLSKHDLPAYVLDASPSNFVSKTALKVIGEMPSSRVMLILRAPVDWLISCFRFQRDFVGLIDQNLSWNDYLKSSDPEIAAHRETMFAHARYIDFIRKWDSVLEPDRLKILIFDDLVAAPRALVRECLDWLGLDAAPIENLKLPAANQTVSTRSHSLHLLSRVVGRSLPAQGPVRASLRAMYYAINTRKPHYVDEFPEALKTDLRARFAPDVVELERRLQRELEGWR